MSKIDDLVEATGAFDCVECGKCTSLCPVTKVDDNFAPRLIVVKAQAGMGKEVLTAPDIWECITCEVCNDMCPYQVDFSGFIQGLRAEATHTENLPVCSEAGAVHTMQRMTGMMGQKQNRLQWLTDDLRVQETGDTYFFTGCSYQLGLLFPDKGGELKKTPASVVKILNAAGIEPVVSRDEVCCGHDLLWTGDEENFEKLMEMNLDAIEKSGADTVVFSCPEGMRTFEVDYKDFVGDLGFEVLHISEFILDLIDEGSLELPECDMPVTYHDSCRLGRHLNIYDPPRDLIDEMGMELIEMPSIKEKAICCGVNAFSSCSEISKVLQLERLKEAKSTGAEAMLTYCPKCLIHYNCLRTMEKLPVPMEEIDIPIREFSNVIAECLENGGSK